MRGGQIAAMAPGGMPAAPPGNVPIGKQLIETFVITLVFSVTMQILESSLTQITRYQAMAVDMFPLTYDGPQTFIQDPASGYPILETSSDERNGTEFSYSCFLNVLPETFTGEKNAFKHVFHKGSLNVFPLMAPGVFFKADNNTLRVYMNSTMAWNNYIDIPNFPVKKWVHLVVMVKGRSLDVYVNGNLANRLAFSDLPKLNYGNFYLFLPKNLNTEKVECPTADAQTTETSAADLAGSPLAIAGSMKGWASKVKYYAFALTYAQIDKLLKEGPTNTVYKPKNPTLSTDATTVVGATLTGKVTVPNSNQFDKNLPGYQTDSWWTSDSHSGWGPE
jgi:hypothetical protein